MLKAENLFAPEPLKAIQKEVPLFQGVRTVPNAFFEIRKNY